MAREDIYINPVTNDVEFDDAGNLKWVTGAERVAQQCRIRVSMGRGNWFRDTRVGVDWQGVVMQRGASDEEIRAEFARELLLVPDVDRVSSIDVQRESGPGSRVTGVTFTVLALGVTFEQGIVV